MSVNLKLSGTLFLGEGENEIDIKQEITEIKESSENITKDNIGLSNVDNTSDIDKPVSTA